MLDVIYWSDMVCSIRNIILYNDRNGERCKEGDSWINDDSSECAVS